MRAPLVTHDRPRAGSHRESQHNPPFQVTPLSRIARLEHWSVICDPFPGAQAFGTCRWGTAEALQDSHCLRLALPRLSFLLRHFFLLLLAPAVLILCLVCEHRMWRQSQLLMRGSADQQPQEHPRKQQLARGQGMTCYIPTWKGAALRASQNTPDADILRVSEQGLNEKSDQQVDKPVCWSWKGLRHREIAETVRPQ